MQLNCSEAMVFTSHLFFSLLLFCFLIITPSSLSLPNNQVPTSSELTFTSPNHWLHSRFSISQFPHFSFSSVKLELDTLNLHAELEPHHHPSCWSRVAPSSTLTTNTLLMFTSRMASSLLLIQPSTLEMKSKWSMPPGSSSCPVS